MSYQLRHVEVLSSLRFHAEPGTVLARFLPWQELPLLVFAQLAATLLAALFSAVCLLGIRISARRAAVPLSRPGWALLGALCLGYLGLTAVLVLRGIGPGTP